MAQSLFSVAFLSFYYSMSNPHPLRYWAYHIDTLKAPAVSFGHLCHGS